MKKQICVLIVGLALAGVLAAPIAAIDVDKLKFPKLSKVAIPDIERITLDNGMRLYLLEDHSLPLFNAGARLNCGSYLDPADKVGLAAMCGQLIRTGGTTKWTGDEIDQKLEDVGGSVETGIEVGAGSAGVNMLSDYTDLGLEVLAQVLRNPVFAEDKIELAKVQARSGIARRNDDMLTLARREWIKLVYGPESPYARHSEYATIDAITRDDLVQFHAQWFHPENIQLAVWGDFDRATMIARINELFADWERGTVAVPPPPPVERTAKPGIHYAPKKDAVQSVVRMGHLGGRYTDEDYPTRLVMNSILNGTFGSRITDNVRTRLGLAYSAAGNVVDQFTYPGYFFSYASTKPQSTVQAAREMITQIKSMQTLAPSAKEMAKGKDGYLNSFVFNFDTKEEIIERLMIYDFYGIETDFLDKEKLAVENCTPESVMAVAQRFLNPDDLAVLIVGKGEEFDEPLENLGLGPVDTIDITIPKPVEKTELVISEENIAKGNALLAEAAKAAGGAAFKGIKSIATKGSLVLHMGGQQMPGSADETTVWPDKTATTLHIGPYTIVSVRDGAQGWQKDPTGAVKEMSDEEIKDSDDERDRTPAYVFKYLDNPYFRAVYESQEMVGDFAIDWIALVKENDDVICRFGIDADKNVRCVRYWGETMAGEGLLQDLFTAFTTVDGMSFPNKSSVTMSGQPIVDREISEITINGSVPDGAFAKPQ